MIQVGQKYGSWMVLKPSGNGFWEISDGKKVIKAATEDIEKGNFKGELMFNVAPVVKVKKKVVKKKTVKKK